MGPPPYMRTAVDRNVVTRRMTVMLLRIRNAEWKHIIL